MEMRRPLPEARRSPPCRWTLVAVRKRRFCATFKHKSPFYQDRLGTNIGTAQKRETAYAGSQLYASINLNPKEAKAYNISDWRQYSFGITTPDNATHISFYSRLQGANVTATWSIADATIVQLDNTLRNVIRTNMTDIEVWSADSSRRYTMGVDYSVTTPVTKDNADDCNLTKLDPYVVKRLASGGITAGESVLMSFDFLPGKVDVQGHSTPNAFAEPEYYAFMDTAIGGKLTLQ